jgi:hypothetical protein
MQDFSCSIISTGKLSCKKMHPNIVTSGEQLNMQHATEQSARN